VVAVARSRADLAETAQLVEQDGGICLRKSLDVCESDDLDAMIQSIAEEFGRIDVLVNNAGVAPHCSVDELDPSLFEMTMAVNCEAVYRACRAVWDVMVQQHDGVIVNISSMSSADPFPGFTLYGASKAWVNAWSKGLADEGRPHGVRVFAVAPGAVETKLLRGVFPQFPADQALAPSDVADVVFALAQPECRHASGQTVFVKR
jgi:NAD(P)-dependent dehydrogenase (short-subunit alcohol dehydrogenase family)